MLQMLLGAKNVFYKCEIFWAVLTMIKTLSLLILVVIFLVSLIRFRRRCRARILVTVAPRGFLTGCVISGTGLRRAGTGRWFLGRAAWWGIRVLSSTRSFFGGGRVGHSRCRGSRPPRWWYADVSGRRISTSVATWLRWTPGSPVPGRFFRDLTRATSLWWFLLFGCSPPAGADVVYCISDMLCSSDRYIIVACELDYSRCKLDYYSNIIVACELDYLRCYFLYLLILNWSCR